MRALVLAGFFLSLTSMGAPVVSSFMESRENKSGSKAYKKYQEQKKKFDKNTLIVGSARNSYKKFVDKVIVPGFISSAPLTDIGSLIGPSNLTASFRIGDTVYIQWVGTPGPREGERYSVFTPAVVLQNLTDPVDFMVRKQPSRTEELPENFRMAGYFYESSGTLRITRIRQGMVEAVIEDLTGQMQMGDRLMPVIPVKTRISPATGGIRLAAAVVSGSPAEKLSTTTRSFVYINRGSRDGIREGRIFQAVESVNLDSSVGSLAPEVSVGEAMVVHVSDSYSTAMITKQFDVIRIGSLLKTKQLADRIEDSYPFKDLVDGGPGPAPSKGEEIPSMSDFSAPEDLSLPDSTPSPEPVAPQAAPAPPPSALSELDALEKAVNFGKLSPKERARLGKLSKQEKLDEDESEEESAPSTAPVDNSFRSGTPAKKSKKTQRRRSSDEEELNQLMMQN